MSRTVEAELTTLCYIEQDNQYLMMHRVKKAHDINEGKWIGVGGHFFQNESPEDCLLREAREETGLTLTSWKLRGIITFLYADDAAEYMFLYTADGFTGTLTDCNEGVLKWIPKDQIGKLNLWDGDRIFLRLLMDDAPCFSLKLQYDADDNLQQAILNGSPLAL
ncbi:MAG: NUDIX domain-containing protein [Eubacterium sp.]